MKQNMKQDRKEKEQFSMNLPLEFVKSLQLEGTMIKLEIVDNVGIIRKIENSSSTLEKDSQKTTNDDDGEYGKGYEIF